MSFVEFRDHIVETCSLPISLSLCDYLWDQLILSSLNLFCKPKFCQLLKRFVKPFVRAWITKNLYSNVWRLIDSEFDKLNSSFYVFIKKSIVNPRERSGMGCHLFLLRKIQFYLMLWGQFVFCHPPWSSGVQCVEPCLCTCYAKSPMNTKPTYWTWMASIYIYPPWLNSWNIEFWLHDSVTLQRGIAEKDVTIRITKV